MNVSNKLKFFGVLFISAVLAACAGKQEIADDSFNDAAADTSAQVDAYQQEQIDSAALEAEKAAIQLSTLYYFEFDSYQLTSDARADLNVAAKLLKETGKNVRLEGHADERGSRDYNLALGENRAKAVANFLMAQGVKNSQLEIISYGEEKPAVLGSNEAAWAKNRRVELIKK